MRTEGMRFQVPAGDDAEVPANSSVYVRCVRSGVSDLLCHIFEVIAKIVEGFLYVGDFQRLYNC